VGAGSLLGKLALFLLALASLAAAGVSVLV
jgi:hypothetical protein